MSTDRAPCAGMRRTHRVVRAALRAAERAVALVGPSSRYPAVLRLTGLDREARLAAMAAANRVNAAWSVHSGGGGDPVVVVHVATPQQALAFDLAHGAALQQPRAVSWRECSRCLTPYPADMLGLSPCCLALAIHVTGADPEAPEPPGGRAIRVRE